MDDKKFPKSSRIYVTALFQHLSNEGNCSFLQDVTLTFIGKTNPKDTKRQEHYLRYRLTMAPLGLNVKTTRTIFPVFNQNFMLICFQPLGLRLWQSGCDLYIGRYRDGLGNLRSTWDGAFVKTGNSLLLLTIFTGSSTLVVPNNSAFFFPLGNSKVHFY